MYLYLNSYDWIVVIPKKYKKTERFEEHPKSREPSIKPNSLDQEISC